jgi:hypothetical protein
MNPTSTNTPTLHSIIGSTLQYPTPTYTPARSTREELANIKADEWDSHMILTPEYEKGVDRLRNWVLMNTRYTTEDRFLIWRELNTILTARQYSASHSDFLNRVRADYYRLSRGEKLVRGEWGWVGQELLDFVECNSGGVLGNGVRFTDMQNYYQLKIRGFSDKERGGSFIHHLHNLKRQDAKRRCGRYLVKGTDGLWRVNYCSTI